jgi:nicotinate-nucleotide pyrophosphorylase (carboxylating)
MYHSALPDGYHSPSEIWKKHLKQGLEEDGWIWDWTALGMRDKAMQGVEAHIIAKSSGVWAGSGALLAVAQLSDELGMPLDIESRVAPGSLVATGDLVSVWRGPARAVVAFERPFLNLVSYVSGIATQTEQLTREVRKAFESASWKNQQDCPRVTATRKTLPHYRDLALEGVLLAGGWSHRYNLAGGVLIKENHIAACGSIEEAVKGAKRAAPHLLRIECEVRNLEECERALRAGADAIMLDNFSVENAKKTLQVIDEFAEVKGLHIPVEISGGLSAHNIAGYVLPGVTLLSSGSLTHSVKALDLSLLVQG